MNFLFKRQLTSTTIALFSCILSSISQIAIATPSTVENSAVEKHRKYNRERSREAISVSSFIFVRPSGATLLVLSSNGTAACDLDGQSPCRFIDTSDRDLLPLDIENVGTLLVDPLSEIECEPIGPARLPRALSCRTMQSETRARLRLVSIETSLGDERLVTTSHGLFRCTKGAGCVQISWAPGAPVVGVSRKSDNDVSLVVPGSANGFLGCSVDFDAKSGRCWKKALNWSDGRSIAISFKQDRFALIRKSAAGLFVCSVRVDQSGISGANDSRCNSRYQSAIADWSKLPVDLTALGNGYARRIQTVSLLPMSNQSHDVRRSAQREVLKHLREMRRSFTTRQLAFLDSEATSDALDNSTFELIAALMIDPEDDNDYLDYDWFNSNQDDLQRLVNELMWGARVSSSAERDRCLQTCQAEFSDEKERCAGLAAVAAVIGAGLGCIVGSVGTVPGCVGGALYFGGAAGSATGTACLAAAYIQLQWCVNNRC